MSTLCCLSKNVYFLSALFVSLTGFHLATKLSSRGAGYTATTVLFLLPTFFMFMYQLFRLVAHVQYYQHRNETALSNLTQCMVDMDERGVAPLMTLDSILHLLQVYVQTSFILHLLQLNYRPGPILRFLHSSRKRSNRSLCIWLCLICVTGFV